MFKRKKPERIRFLVIAVDAGSAGEAASLLDSVRDLSYSKLHPLPKGDFEAFTLDSRCVVKSNFRVSGRRARRMVSGRFRGCPVSVEEWAGAGFRTRTVFGDADVFRGPFYVVIFGFLDELDDSVVFASRDLSVAKGYFDGRAAENLKADYERDGISWEPPEYAERDFGHFRVYATQSGVCRVGSVDFRLLRVNEL